MEYIIENEFLQVRVTDRGAQVAGVLCKADGVQHIWQADPAVWGWYGPILFPYCGKVVGDTIRVRGTDYPAPKHGFARNMVHSLLEQSRDRLVLCLEDSAETRAQWPFPFRLLSVFQLEGDRLHHSLTVENPGTQILRFGIGFHPAYAIPFDAAHSWQDYVLRFDRPQSPICLNTLPSGLIQGDCYSLGQNLEEISISPDLFANDGHCMTGLSAQTLGIYEKDSSRAVICTVSGFPYTLLWSKPGIPEFVCIEPWHSLPSWENGSTEWDQKAAAAAVQPGGQWTATLTAAFRR